MPHQGVHEGGRPLNFNLSRRKPSKTLDIGHNKTSLSADPLGRILQLSTFHPKHGIVVASPYEQFDGSKFHDPTYTRAYRARMLDSIQQGRPGFGLRIDGEIQDVCIDLQNSRQAHIQYEIQKDISVSTTLHIQDDGELVQTSTILSTAEIASFVRYTLDLGVSVNRASYGQLTEGGPIPIPKSENKLEVLNEGTAYAIVNPHLGAHLRGCLELDGELVRLDRDVRASNVSGKPLAVASSGVLQIPPKASRKLCARYHLLPTTAIDTNFHAMQQSTITSLNTKWSHEDSDALFIVRRNLDYILGNCAIPVTDQAVALITDHVALPLGWNRDNYWQVRFLLDMYHNIDNLAGYDLAKDYRNMIKTTTRGHVNWAFHLAQRPQKFWHRSYLVTGRPKDGPVFQLDQQCYPLLELCDFLDVFAEEEAFVQGILAEETVAEILEMMDSKRDSESGLYTTEETPGDDAVEYPFHFSSQILLWYTLSRMCQLVKHLGETRLLKVSVLSKRAEDLRRSTMKHFLTHMPGNSAQLFAYLVDGKGQKTFYHDANDIPTLFAVEWGFLRATSEIEAWRNTIAFALSEANEGGYYAGKSFKFGGLGSVHTRGPWPLGYLQEFLYADMTNDTAAEQDAWRRIKAAMQWDGLFSEAVDINTAQCTSKAWFSWPGSMIGSALLRPEFQERYMKPSKKPSSLKQVPAYIQQDPGRVKQHGIPGSPVSEPSIIMPQSKQQLAVLA